MLLATSACQRSTGPAGPEPPATVSGNLRAPLSNQDGGKQSANDGDVVQGQVFLKFTHVGSPQADKAAQASAAIHIETQDGLNPSTTDSGLTNLLELPPVSWSQGITVASLLQTAADPAASERALTDKEPSIDLVAHGSGSAFFVDSLLGMKNGEEPNCFWTFRVNGKLADKSAGVYVLQPGDQVEWRFGPYEE